MVNFYIVAHAVPKTQVKITSHDDGTNGPSCENVYMVAKLIFNYVQVISLNWCYFAGSLI